MCTSKWYDFCVEPTIPWDECIIASIRQKNLKDISQDFKLSLTIAIATKMCSSHIVALMEKSHKYIHTNIPIKIPIRKISRNQNMSKSLCIFNFFDTFFGVTNEVLYNTSKDYQDINLYKHISYQI